jgi:hypothetical protein
MTTPAIKGRPNRGYGKGRILRSVPWSQADYALIQEACWLARTQPAVLIRNAALAQARRILRKKPKEAA